MWDLTLLIYALLRRLVSRVDGTRGAYVSACAAVNAYIGVDRVLGLALTNCSGRALTDAGAASHAGIIRYISHSCDFF